MELNKKNKDYSLYFICTILFAFLLRAAAAVGFFNSFDTYWYRNWAVDLPNGLFSVYARADLISLDYPPLYLILLYPIGLIYSVVGVGVNDLAQMALLKFWPVVFDVLISAALYLILRKKDESTALICSLLWAINPSAIFNSSFWGQTDSVMVFFLLLAFWFLYKKRPYLASIIFALAGMVKYQSLFFTPVFLIYLWLDNTDKTKFFKGILSAAATIIAVFLPFMAASKKPLLFFEVYFGGADTYKYCTLNACNLFGMLGLNWHSDENLWGILGIVLVVISIIGILVLFIKSKLRCPFAGAMLIMQCVFMFSTRMHERYQFAAVIFALLSYAVYQHREFLIAFISLSVITFLNQALLLFMWHNPENPFFANYETFIIYLSVINLLVFVYTVFITVKLFLNKKEEITENVESV